MNTDHLIDEIIDFRGSERNAIAYLLGALESAEEKNNRIKESFGAPTRRTTIEWLEERRLEGLNHES